MEAYRYGYLHRQGIEPRTEATSYSVDDICKDVEAKQGEKRVAVVLDYGTAEDAGSGRPRPSRVPPARRCRPRPAASRCSTRSPRCGSRTS